MEKLTNQSVFDTSYRAMVAQLNEGRGLSSIPGRIDSGAARCMYAKAPDCRCAIGQILPLPLCVALDKTELSAGIEGFRLLVEEGGGPDLSLVDLRLLGEIQKSHDTALALGRNVPMWVGALAEAAAKFGLSPAVLSEVTVNAQMEHYEGEPL